MITYWFKTTQIHSVTFQEVVSLKLRCWGGHAPSKGSKGGFFLSFPQFLVIIGHLAFCVL